ncbi:GNAT family N-acetyltransferase [Streptomyces sp. VRA16 Mangrove soil]|uniref:GNAT family N-acetyltransferase n=1 Tax=Streptomyces sp. VRA16 Mangrove soil TaxID=2817434 RepID=UPI001A9EEB3F|nr:GNAT family N-acetyltransferase [Streptomyces sp. VRA16 Mangrove soil]MBO1337680.1 GNAT family N-acetyltransferase [Streptomyces sp. VRA16 Mangrove soil]
MVDTQAHEGAGKWWLTRDPEEFERRAGAFLRADPALHTVPLSVLAGLLAKEARFDGTTARFGVWTDAAGEVAGALLWTPPFPPYVSPLGPDAAEALVAAIDADLPVGVGGTVEGARAVADAWLRRHPGGSVTEGMAQRLYVLGELAPPAPAPPGTARVAGPADRDLLARWFKEFSDEAAGGIEDRLTREQALAWADSRISYGGATLWLAPDGTPVALAGVTRLVGGSVRVAPVYTPKELRGRGYGGAATAEVSRAALAAGADAVVLFTDLANPTSNALYQRLGYRPVRDFTVLRFTATATP